MQRLLILTLLMTAAASVSAARAQDGALRQACGADVRSVCAGVMPGGGRIKQCMMEKFDKLSDGCKAALKDKQAQSGAK
jgi:hypothetical protein